MLINEMGHLWVDFSAELKVRDKQKENNAELIISLALTTDLSVNSRTHKPGRLRNIK